MPVMELARRRGIQVQARSVLSSGLLAGKYSETSVWQFEDSIRRRYRETPENLEIFKKRWKSVEAIDEYRRGLVAEGRFQGDLAAFAYQCMMSSPLVDTVIVGGSELPQVCANLDNYLIRLDNLAIDAVFSRLIQEWRAPFL